MIHEGFAQGGAGAMELADAVIGARSKPASFNFITPNDTGVVEQIEAIATTLYGAAGVDLQSGPYKSRRIS